MPNKELQDAFERLARNRDMKDVLAYFETTLGKMCDVRNIKIEDIESTRKASEFIQREFIERFKRYEPIANTTDNNLYL